MCVTPADAAAELRFTAARFAAGTASIQDMWHSFHGHLADLCAEEPLDGEFLQLFNDLEAWEASVGDNRERAVEAVRGSAERLAAGA